MKKPKVIVITGPTASGKTAWAMELAKKYNGEIISADSQQVYKDFNIGTGKEGKLKRSSDPLKVHRIAKGIPQYLVDFVKPSEQFNVADFQKLCLKKLDQIIKSGKIPFIVGGTGLYIDAVCEGYLFQKESSKKKIAREKLEKLSLEELLNKLKKLDPKSVQKIDKKNKRRIIRALEVTINSGIPYSAQLKVKKLPYKFLKLGVFLPMAKLQARINRRVDEMIKAGLILETRKLLEKYPKSSPPFASLGYKEICEYLLEKYDIKEAVEIIKKNTWQFAKRQMTWFRKSPNLIWVKNIEEADRLIEKFLK